MVVGSVTQAIEAGQFKEAEQQIDCTFGHVDNGLDAGAELVVTLQEICLARQVLFDRFLHARIEQLRMRRGIERS